MSDQEESPRPQHRIEESVVAVPTIRIIVGGMPDGSPGLFVQWYGETSTRKFENFQFQFPVPASINDPAWMGYPTRFRVLFLGRVQDWPRKDAVDLMNLQYGPDTWIMWIIAAFHPADSELQRGAPMFAIFMKIMLADSFYGIITPQTYQDTKELARLETERKATQWRIHLTG